MTPRAAPASERRRLPRGRDRCAGCHSERRAELDADIVAKVPFRELAKRYAISSTALFRHKRHVAVSLVRVEAPAPLSSVGSIAADSTGDVDVLGEARRLYEDCRAALDGAVRAGNLLSLSLAAREVHRALELLGRQLERIESRRGAVVIDYATLPAAVEMRVTMMHALAGFPDARLAVAAALAELEDA